MAYNNMFPMNYQQFQPQYIPQPQLQQPQQSSGVIWVQGEAGAKSYLVAPNTTVQLWDSENPVIYLKSADASGMPTMRVLDYTFRDAPKPQTTTDYITREEFEERIKKLEKPTRSREVKSNE